MKKQKLLILCQKQWGYHVDTYKYATLLTNEFNITYVCWDYGYKKIDSEDVCVKYISRNGSLLARNTKYIRATSKEISTNLYDICFIKYFRGCSLLKIIYRKFLFVFDIRTGAVGNNKAKRMTYDFFMKFESRFFRNITVISQSLSMRLGLQKKAHILPLGSDIISKTDKQFDKIRLIYIGTLNGRNISKTIGGFKMFLQNYSNKVDAIYSIVGDGKEMPLLKEKIRHYGLEKTVHLLGQVPFCDLKPLMDSHNIGVSFVPCTDYFDCQPVTKTFDYLLSGLPVIATATTENKAVIHADNGVCINDNAEEFYKGITKVWKNRDSYQSKNIRESAKLYEWKYVAADLIKYLHRLIDQNHTIN